MNVNPPTRATRTSDLELVSPVICALLACPLWALAALAHGEASLSTFWALCLAATWTLPPAVLALHQPAGKLPQWLTPAALVCCLLVAPCAVLAAWLKLNTNLRPLAAVTLSTSACGLAGFAWWLTRGLGFSSRLRKFQPALLLGLALAIAAMATQTEPPAQLFTFAMDLASLSLLVWLSSRLGRGRSAPRWLGARAVLGLWLLCVSGSVWGVDWQRAWDCSAIVAGPGALLFTG